MQKGSVVQRFSYDAQGKVVAVDYSENGGSSYTTYYYLRNAQGDIVKLIDGNKSTMVEYTYDSWGKLISTTGSLATSLGAKQPFRYRGYVYDTETQWYYLQSRYYDPNTCRFISNDIYLSTGQGVIGHNSYAYCGNNPIHRIDDEGTFWWISFGIGLFAQYAGDVINNIASGKTEFWDIITPTSSIGEYLASGVAACIPGSGIGSALARSAVTETFKIGEALINNEEVDIGETVKNLCINTVVDFGLGKISDGIDAKIEAKKPRNYSSHAHRVRGKKPNATKIQIEKSMHRRYRNLKTVQRLSRGISNCMGAALSK